MIRIRLSEEQREELMRVSRQAVGRVAPRAQMVLLSGRGYSVPQVASIHDCGMDVVRAWLHRYEERGVAGLEDEPRSGRPPKDPLAGDIVDAQASQSPCNSGLAQSCWTVALLAASLAARLGLAPGCASVRRYLRLAGLRWRRPGWTRSGSATPGQAGSWRRSSAREELRTAWVRGELRFETMPLNVPDAPDRARPAKCRITDLGGLPGELRDEAWRRYRLIAGTVTGST